ncbi:hypothetical protein [Comamonas aquatica]|uniref:hypothetical protein n=1 Tax=Comamonas aquatica TaxID=225991 RepID=UPI00244A466E|nr:hypothetical protein [Comamonas aquatica]MDH0495729.1 hypothetical protein [Comamonas aquatica]
MPRTVRTYQVTVIDGGKHISLTTQQRSGGDAATYALSVYPWARSVSTKPINSYRAA